MRHKKESPMKTVRKIDLLGRIVIPIDMRRAYHLEPGGYVELVPALNGVSVQLCEPGAGISTAYAHMYAAVQESADLSDERKQSLLAKLSEVEQLL